MNFYNNEKIFNAFLNERNDVESPFNFQVKPVMLNFMEDITNKSILDLGCGLGHFSEELSKLGAKNVLGIDISEKEISYATSHHKPTNVEYKVLNALNLTELNQTFDIISSGIVVDYVENFDELLKQVYNCLNNDGIFVFSQVHPFSTSPKEKRKWLCDEKSRYIYQLCDYSFEGKREMNYFDGKVEMYHRTFSTLINSILKAGFNIEQIAEPVPNDKELQKYPDRIKNLHKPSFLIFKLSKKNG